MALLKFKVKNTAVFLKEYTNKNFKTQNSHFSINYCCPAYTSVLCESKDLVFDTIQINNEYNEYFSRLGSLLS